MYFSKPSLNENDMAIIERGDVATHSIQKGQYVSWHGKIGKANSDILQGTSLNSTLFNYIDDGALNNVSNNWVCLIENQTISTSGTTMTLSDNIENYNEIFIRLHTYVSSGTYKRGCTMTIPVNEIIKYGYNEKYQYILSAIGSTNISSSKMTYAMYSQLAFLSGTSLKAVYLDSVGWSGSYYITVWAK